MFEAAARASVPFIAPPISLTVKPADASSYIASAASEEENLVSAPIFCASFVSVTICLPVASVTALTRLICCSNCTPVLTRCVSPAAASALSASVARRATVPSSCNVWT